MLIRIVCLILLAFACTPVQAAWLFSPFSKRVAPSYSLLSNASNMTIIEFVDAWNKEIAKEIPSSDNIASSGEIFVEHKFSADERRGLLALRYVEDYLTYTADDVILGFDKFCKAHNGQQDWLPTELIYRNDFINLCKVNGKILFGVLFEKNDTTKKFISQHPSRMDVDKYSNKRITWFDYHAYYYPDGEWLAARFEQQKAEALAAEGKQKTDAIAADAKKVEMKEQEEIQQKQAGIEEKKKTEVQKSREAAEILAVNDIIEKLKLKDFRKSFKTSAECRNFEKQSNALMTRHEIGFSNPDEGRKFLSDVAVSFDECSRSATFEKSKLRYAYETNFNGWKLLQAVWERGVSACAVGDRLLRSAGGGGFNNCKWGEMPMQDYEGQSVVRELKSSIAGYDQLIERISERNKYRHFFGPIQQAVGARLIKF